MKFQSLNPIRFCTLILRATSKLLVNMLFTLFTESIWLYLHFSIITLDMDEVEAILGSPMYFLQDELMITDEDFGLRIPSESKVLGDPIQIQNKIEFSAPEASLTDSINKAITFPSNIEEVIPAGGSCSNQEAQAQTLNLSRPSVIVHTSQFLPESKRKSQTVYSEEGLTHNRKNVTPSRSNFDDS